MAGRRAGSARPSTAGHGRGVSRTSRRPRWSGDRGHRSDRRGRGSFCRRRCDSRNPTTPSPDRRSSRQSRPSPARDSACGRSRLHRWRNKSRCPGYRHRRAAPPRGRGQEQCLPAGHRAEQGGCPPGGSPRLPSTVRPGACYKNP